jgi:uncharacterized protein YcbX
VTTVTAGRVRKIWRYPMKSMAGQPLECSDVAANAVATAPTPLLQINQK